MLLVLSVALQTDANTLPLLLELNNNNNSCIALYPVQNYKLAALYIINIKICLTIKKVQVL